MWASLTHVLLTLETYVSIYDYIKGGLIGIAVAVADVISVIKESDVKSEERFLKMEAKTEARLEEMEAKSQARLEKIEANMEKILKNLSTGMALKGG